jgi:His/Glu/Gln/Arg/opine family amino acid ABC transporter permease subunit
MWYDELIRQFNSTFIIDDRYQLFIEGFKNTLIITSLATLLGCAIGILIAVVKVYYHQTGKAKFLNHFCSLYLTIIRGTPVNVQLLIMYFIIFSNLDSGVFIAILTFGINSGAYVAEIFRAGIMAINEGQTEAGRSLGLSGMQTMRLIILPQATKNILPAMGNEFIALLKETSIVGYVAVVDLTRAGDLVRASTMQPFFSLLFVALVYLLLVLLISKLLQSLERRLRKSDRSQASQ